MADEDLLVILSSSGNHGGHDGSSDTAADVAELKMSSLLRGLHRSIGLEITPIKRSLPFGPKPLISSVIALEYRGRVYSQTNAKRQELTFRGREP